MPGETQRPLTSSSGGSVEAGLQTLEEKVTLLAGRIEQIEQRLSGLGLPSVPQAWPLGEATLQGRSGRSETTRWVTLLGRSCVILGGAFLIRALTDGRTLPGGLGVALGILFAATWVFFAHRAAVSGATLSAGFHGVVAAVVAYPLVLESSTRLGVMSTSAAALTLLGFTALLLMVSWRDRLGWLAWIGVLSCLLTTLALLIATPARAELTVVLLVLAAATFFWLGDRPECRGLRWPAAVVLDLVVLRAVVTSTPPVLVFSLALAVLSLGLVLFRTGAAARGVGAFEVLQTVAGLVIGLVGALRVAPGEGVGAEAVAGGVLAASVLTTVFAGWVVPHRGDRDLDFLFYGALSLALLSLGVALLTPGDLRGVLWAILALLVVLVGRWRHPLSLWSLAVLLALGAAFSSGLMGGIWQTLGGREAIHWRTVSPWSVTVLGLVILAYLATVPPLRPSLSSPESWPSLRAAAAVFLLLGSAGLAALVLHGLRSITPDLARLAGARTVAAVAMASSLALVRRRVARPELSWMAILALTLGGVELVLVELPNGRPSTLLVSFVLYGAGLILVPRVAPLARDLRSSSRSDNPMVTRP